MMFVVWPKADNKHDYLDAATKLHQLREEIESYLSIARFESLAEPGMILSLGIFKI